MWSSTADFSTSQQFSKAEMLRGLRNFLNMDRPGCKSMDHLKKSGKKIFLKKCINVKFRSRLQYQSTAKQGRNVERLEEFSEHGQTGAQEHGSPEEKRSGRRKRLVFYSRSWQMTCVLPKLTGTPSHYPIRGLVLVTGLELVGLVSVYCDWVR